MYYVDFRCVSKKGNPPELPFHRSFNIHQFLVLDERFGNHPLLRRYAHEIDACGEA